VRMCGKLLGFIPLNTRDFDPEVSVLMLAPISHSFGIKELNAKVEAGSFLSSVR